MAKHNCSICGKPIVLIPSAKERAEKYGETPEYYKRLFDTHYQCSLAKREQDTLELMRKITGRPT